VQIAALYGRLLELAPTPVIALNHAVAVAESGRLEDGLRMIERIDGLERYHLRHSARADMLRRLGRPAEARAAYEAALGLTRNPAEARFLRRRLDELRGGEAI
jgi:RNA polymerase sigma-70 factor (ECF subfamily)